MSQLDLVPDLFAALLGVDDIAGAVLHQRDVRYRQRGRVRHQLHRAAQGLAGLEAELARGGGVDGRVEVAVFDRRLLRVGSNASTTSQESPVKYSDFDAAIDTATARKLGLKPGQALRGTVELVAQPAALTVPNIALVQDGAGYVVYTEEGGKQIRHKVVLGQRGPVRSELKGGVAAGARIVLLPPAPTEKS